MTEICQTFLMVSAAYGQGRIQGVKMRGTHLPPVIFRTVFDAYNFFIVSNLFDSNKPYALSTHNRTCANKIHHIFGETLRIRFKNFKQNLPENYSKCTKIAITASKFSKFSGGMPPDPPRIFLFSPSASNLF